jgi:hypothetical protein
MFCARNKSRPPGEQNYCVRKTNLTYLENSNIASKEQISSSRETKKCVRGTHLIYVENENTASRENISSTLR